MISLYFQAIIIVITYYDTGGTFVSQTDIKLFNGEKYKFIYDGFSDKEVRFQLHQAIINVLTFGGTYDNSYDGIITFTVNGIDNLTTLYVYDGKDV